MKLLRLEMYNFIGIYNGMGLDRLIIDFSKCTHNIIVIKGDNGTGKSTLYKALQPLSDNTLEIIPSLPGKKVLIYLLDDGSELYIEYRYAVDNNGNRKPARCIIKRNYNGISNDLNPSMNMTSGKDIIFDFFDLDDNYILLSQLSAHNKGLGGLKPGDRKRYVNNIISGLEEYNNLYKLFSKKSIGLKSLINSITTKLQQIGNIDIIQNSIKTNMEQLQSLEQQKDVLVLQKAQLMNRLDEMTKDGDIISIYKEYSEKKKSLELEIGKVPDMKDYSEEKLIISEKELTKLEVQQETYSKDLNDLIVRKDNLIKEIDRLNVELEMSKDPNTPDYDQEISSLQKSLHEYYELFIKIGFTQYDNISEEEYNTCIDGINNFNNTIEYFVDKYEYGSIVEKGFSIANHEEQSQSEYYKSLIDKTNMGILELTKQKIELETKKSIIDNGYNKIPYDCPHKQDSECPFIQDITKAKQSYSQQEYDDIINRYNKLNDDLKAYTDIYNESLQIDECAKDISLLLASITPIQSLLKKFPDTDNVLTKSKLRWSIINFMKINIDLSKYKEYTNYITLISNTKKDLHELQIKRDQYNNTHEKLSQLRDTNKKNMDELFKLRDREASMNEEITTINTKINEYKKYVESLYYIKANKSKFDNIEQDLQNVNDKLEKLLKMKDDYEILNRECIDVESKLNRLTKTDIPLIKNQLDKAKYSISLYEQYKKDYDEYNKTFSTVQMFRQYSSVNGIQTIYMEAFMNSILQLANDLLRNLFNGRFVLQPFVINSNEFRIPCIDNDGNMRSDISYMSDSQLSMISMIISFALLHKASGKYNIIKLDEVDSNLDNTNRLQFSLLISHIMNLLQFSQCIIISHNNELDLSNTDMILFKVQNEDNYQSLLSSGGNIICDVNQR